MLKELSLPSPRLRSSAITGVDLPALVDTYAATLFRVAHSLLRNRAEAEDVVQDTFVRVLELEARAHRSPLPAVRELRPWLIRITWNLALDRLRRARPEQADELFLQSLVAHDRPVDRALLEAQQARRVLDTIDRLPAAERQALLLSALDELSTAEIAATLEKSESAVRALIFRARSRLRERLSPGTRNAKGGK